MDLMSLIVQSGSGLVGGYWVGCCASAFRLDTREWVPTGLIGGLLGGQIIAQSMGMPGSPSGVLDLGTLAAHAAGGGSGGILLTVAVGWLVNALER
jgi:hypothetical protein